MGCFSWKTMDTDRSISSEDSTRGSFPVTMTDNKGNRWHESKYEGYGNFGGKDYYQLLAEMNGKEDREDGINLACEGKAFLFPNLTEDPDWEWENAAPEDCEFQGYFY